MLLFLMDIHETLNQHVNYIINDNACHLSEYVKANKVYEKPDISKFLKDVKFDVDKFHLGNHVKSCQRQNFNPNFYDFIKKKTTILKLINKFIFIYFVSQFKAFLMK